MRARRAMLFEGGARGFCAKNATDSREGRRKIFANIVAFRAKSFAKQIKTCSELARWVQNSQMFVQRTPARLAMVFDRSARRFRAKKLNEIARGSEQGLSCGQSGRVHHGPA